MEIIPPPDPKLALKTSGPKPWLFETVMLARATKTDAEVDAEVELKMNDPV